MADTQEDALRRRIRLQQEQARMKQLADAQKKEPVKPAPADDEFAIGEAVPLSG